VEGRKPRNGSSALMRHSIDQPLMLDVFLAERQLLAVGDADHLLDEVQPGDELGDRVLDLQAGVHLEEVELLGRAADHELDRAGDS
jgi:hypothetical protein